MSLVTHTVPRGAPWRHVWRWALPAIALVVVVSLVAAWRMQRERMQYRLLAVTPAVAGADPALVRFATSMAKPLFAKNCARCHGANMRGNPVLGAPNLTDKVWLYDTGSVFDIERTILFGIRSGQGKARNVTDMPAYGLTNRLNDGQIRSLVQYLLKLSGRPYQAGAANEGKDLYYGPINCGDCHGTDAKGDGDYGSPDLTINVWNNGGDVQSLHDSIYFGRHRIMPAWLGPLSLVQIRALAVYIHSVSDPDTALRPRAAPHQRAPPRQGTVAVPIRSSSSGVQD